MSKFKVGDRVRIVGDCSYSSSQPELIGVEVVIPEYSSLWFNFMHEGSCRTIFAEDYDKLELITSKETKPMAQRTFKLLKDTPTVKKGAIYQEQCDDGTQPYILLDTDFLKDGDHDPTISNRELVEDSTFFIEVFAVEPAWMTQAELDRYHVFLNAQYPAKRKYTKKPKYGPSPNLTKNGKRIGRPPKK